MSVSPVRHLGAPIPIDELIERVGEAILARSGPSDAVIDNVASLESGGSGSLVFCSLVGDKGMRRIEGSRASTIVVGAMVPIGTNSVSCILRVADPARWFVRAITVLFPEQTESLVHPTAHVENGARIGSGSHIGPGAFIAANVTLGRNCRIGPNCSIGGSGLAVERDERGLPLPYPHIGDVVIGDGVRIGANSVVVRGILETTRIDDHCQIGNMVNVGHNCVIGRNCWISSGVVLCGSVILGDGVMIGAGAAINNHVTVGDEAVVGLGSIVTKTVAAGQRVFGVPAKPLPTMRSL